MPALSAYASVLCTIAALSNAQHPHYHQGNHYAPPGAVAPSSIVSSSAASTASSSTATVAVVELDSSPNSSPVVVSSASSSTSSTGSDTAATSSSSITPKGVKAGIAGFPGIQNTNAAILTDFAPYISWYSDYWPNTTEFTGNGSTVMGIGMLWGNGELNETDPTVPVGDPAIAQAATGDSNRYKEYGTITSSSTPTYMMGFYEPDWPCPYSSNMNAQTAASAWASTLGKLDNTLIGSPSMARQLDENWLEPFMEALGVKEPPWDYTCIHTNKNSSQGVQDDVGYYWNKYGKPVWVSEFACVNDQSADWSTCDQETTYTFITDVVEFFENNSTVVAYGYSNGAVLGSVWPLINNVTEELTPSGSCYLNVLAGKPCTST